MHDNLSYLRKICPIAIHFLHFWQFRIKIPSESLRNQDKLEGRFCEFLLLYFLFSATYTCWC